jgi:hypothetical protein
MNIKKFLREAEEGRMTKELGNMGDEDNASCTGSRLSTLIVRQLLGDILNSVERPLRDRWQADKKVSKPPKLSSPSTTSYYANFGKAIISR